LYKGKKNQNIIYHGKLLLH